MSNASLARERRYSTIFRSSLNPWTAIIGAGIILAAAGFILAVDNGLRPAIIAAVLGWVIGFFLAAIVVSAFVSTRPYRLIRQVPLDSSAIFDHGVRTFGLPPWVLSRDVSYQLVYWRRLEPRPSTAILLSFCGVIPALLYVFLSRGTQTVALSTTPTRDGTRLEIYVQPQSPDGRRIAARFFNSLHDLR